MSNGAKISILGLWQWDNSIFDMMSFPEYEETTFSEENKQTLINNILAECAELEILYPNPVVMKNMIGIWSAKEKITWNRIFRAALAEYDPIENYHRTEKNTRTLDHADTHSGTDSNQQSGSDSGTSGYTDTNSGDDVNLNKVMSYDSGTLLDHDEQTFSHGHVLTNSGSNSMTYGRKDSFTHGEKIQYSGSITDETEAYGNIGVTTSQQMLESELVVSAKLNVYNYIIESFKERFCLMVY